MDSGDNDSQDYVWVKGILLLLAVSTFHVCKHSVLRKVRSVAGV
jgi:hypothetical protein